MPTANQGGRQPARADREPANYLLFPLGQLLSTPGALRTLDEFGHQPVTLIRRHGRGDWGDLSDEDRQVNEMALVAGARIFSSYTLTRRTGKGQETAKVWCITEADRRCTTLLLPSEY